MEVTFHGAAEGVTGSKTILKTSRGLFLIDCGMYQGPGDVSKRNRAPFAFDPKELKGVFLTHSHIDHSGLLPRLIKEGYKGPIFLSVATKELLKIMLEDSANLQKPTKSSKEKLPIYTIEDVYQTIERTRACQFEENIHFEGIQFKLHRAGHILGASSITIQDGKNKIFFSGDYGREDDVLIPPPSPPEEDFDAVVIEGTYGDREHPEESVNKVLKECLDHIIKNKSVLVIPAFAVARAQALMYLFHELAQENKKYDIPLMISSPMTEKVTHIYEEFVSELKIDKKKAKDVFRSARFLKWKKEMDNINRRSGPMILLAASGMATGGRIVGHLKVFAEDSKNIILISGYQAPETPGRKILDGEKRIYVDGQKIDIHASVKSLSHLSAHGDREDLTKLIHRYGESARVFLGHGELETLEAFAKHLKSIRPNQEIIIPKEGESWSVSK